MLVIAYSPKGALTLFDGSNRCENGFLTLRQVSFPFLEITAPTSLYISQTELKESSFRHL